MTGWLRLVGGPCADQPVRDPGAFGWRGPPRELWVCAPVRHPLAVPGPWYRYRHVADDVYVYATLPSSCDDDAPT